MTDFPDLRPAFPHTTEFIVNGQLSRHDVDHQPGCGYVSDQEAELLWRAAQDFPGLWVEIGSHTGWSGAHIAQGLNMRDEVSPRALVAIEPQYVYLDFFRRARCNWHRALVDDLIYPAACTSANYFKGCVETFSGAFIDGDHSPGAPLEDAQMVLPRLAERAVVFLHDGSGEPVQEAARFLHENGFRVHEYTTMGSMVVCWRGDWEPWQL